MAKMMKTKRRITQLSLKCPPSVGDAAGTQGLAATQINSHACPSPAPQAESESASGTTCLSSPPIRIAPPRLSMTFLVTKAAMIASKGGTMPYQGASADGEVPAAAMQIATKRITATVSLTFVFFTLGLLGIRKESEVILWGEYLAVKRSHKGADRQTCRFVLKTAVAMRIVNNHGGMGSVREHLTQEQR